MTYRIADREAGPDARGLAAGTCAYVKREGMPHELAKIDFETAGNAQIVQARTGGTVDRSPTAAVRYPDANTIPAYMLDPAHYWNFHLTVAQPSTATAHAAWRPTIGVGERAGQSTTRSNPQSVGNRTREGAATTANTAKVVDPPLIFRQFIRKPNEYWMRFSARANASPTVEYSDQPPQRINGRLGFQYPQKMTVKQGAAQNFAAEYTTAPLTNIKVGKYYYVINVPAGPDGQSAREYTGDFLTISQNVIVYLTRIDVLNDSDDDSDGDLGFNFNLAPSPETISRCNADGRGRENCFVQLGPVSWSSNSTHGIEIKLNRNQMPDKVRIWVNGGDDDNFMGDGFRVRNAPYGSSGVDHTLADYNTASGEFNIGPYKPGLRYPFKLRSKDGATLMFEVHGEIEVVRF